MWIMMWTSKLLCKPIHFITLFCQWLHKLLALCTSAKWKLLVDSSQDTICSPFFVLTVKQSWSFPHVVVCVALEYYLWLIRVVFILFGLSGGAAIIWGWPLNKGLWDSLASGNFPYKWSYWSNLAIVPKQMLSILTLSASSYKQLCIYRWWI